MQRFRLRHNIKALLDAIATSISGIGMITLLFPTSMALLPGVHICFSVYNDNVL